MSTMILSRKDIKKVIRMEDVIEAVSSVYQRKAENKTVVWPLVHHTFKEKKALMDIRSGYIMGEQLHGLKMLNNFPLNREQGLQPFNGVLLVFDSNTGIPLGIMDAAYITGMRTGAAAAIGAKALARPDSKTVLIVGAGKQAIYQVAAVLTLFKELEQVMIADPLDADNARAFVDTVELRLIEEFSADLVGKVNFEAAGDLEAATKQSDIIITITPARSPIIHRDWVEPGTHFSCIGADMEGKEEIEGAILKDAKIFVDDIEQCIKVGEIERPLQEKIISESNICGDIGQLLIGEVDGRAGADDITVFDATGLALLDLAAARVVIDRAESEGIGVGVDL